MLAALAGAGIEPDLVLGTSIGGINGAFVAAHPVSGVTHLGELWRQDRTGTLLGDSLVSQLRTLRRTLISLHSNDQLESLLSVALEASTHIEDLPTPFGCVASCIETASATCRLIHDDPSRPRPDERRPWTPVLSMAPPTIAAGLRHTMDPAATGCALRMEVASLESPARAARHWSQNGHRRRRTGRDLRGCEPVLPTRLRRSDCWTGHGEDGKVAGGRVWGTGDPGFKSPHPDHETASQRVSADDSTWERAVDVVNRLG